MRPVRDLTMGSIYQTKDGRYRAAITVGYDGKGRQVRRTVSAKTQAECVRRRNELFIKLKKGRATPEEITVETHVTRWLETTAAETFSPNNLRNHKSYASKYIIPTLGQYKLSDVGADEVRELDKAVRDAHVSSRTVQMVRSSLSVCMEDAVKRGLIERNPCSQVPRPRAVSKKRTSLTADEARHLIVHSAQVGDPFATLWAAFLFLGPRKGELLGLQRSKVGFSPAGCTAELDRALVEVSWAHGEGCRCGGDVRPSKCPERGLALPPGYDYEPLWGNLILAPPKTSSSVRLVHVPAPLDAMLWQHVQVTPSNRWGLMWVSERGYPLRPKVALARWKSALKSAGLPIVDLHTARHTAASLLAECGVPPQVIGVILGQSTVDTTLGYVHVGRAQAQAALAQYAERLALPTSYGQSPQVGDGFPL